MADLSQISDAQLMHLITIGGLESNNAPDSSTIQSPKAASGSMQVEPATRDKPGFGVKPSNGTPEDTAREGRDYYLALENHYKDPTTAAMAYNWGTGNVDKWLKAGGDPSKIPDETLKYAVHFNAANPQGRAADMSGLSTSAPSSAAQRGQAAIKAMAPNVPATGAALTGLGETGAQMASGMFGQAAGALHGAYDLATGSTYDQAHADLDKERNAVTYEPKTDAGKQISDNVGQMFDKYLTQPLEQGGQAVGEAFGFDPQTAKQGAEIGTSLFENLGIPALMHGMAPKMGAVDHGAASQLDMLNAAQTAGDRVEPSMPAQPPVMEPNAGPQRPPISVDSAGNAVDPLNPPDPGNVAGQMAQAAAEQRARLQAGDLFPETLGDEGNASPFNPNQMAGVEDPAARGVLSNRRQGELQLDNNEPIRVSPEGEAFPESQAANRDMMQQRTAELQWTPPEQLDPMSGVDHPNVDAPAADRSLAPEEFTKAVQTLAERDPNKFSLPADMDKAFKRYTDIVRDEAGDMLSKSESAKRFAEAVTKQMIEQRVQDHPVVKANQARVDQLKAQLEQKSKGLGLGSEAALRKSLDTAEKTLQKSQDNIGKFFEPTAKGAAPFYAKDGAVNLYTFGHLPEMFRSIGAILKGLHGMVFKTLDRMIPNFQNLKGMKIAGQGIKDFVNKQANKDWTQQVNEQPRQVLKGVDGLRDGLKDYLPDPEDIPPEALKEQMQSVPDLSGESKGLAQLIRANFLTGQQMKAYTHHPLVKYAVDTMDRAQRAAQQFVREQIVGKNGLMSKIRAMSEDELTGIWAHMEANEGVREFTDAQLKSQGFSDKQIDFYRQRLQLNDQKLAALNAGRAVDGLKPVDRRIAHIAGHFLGDFKRIITDKDGTVKAVIAHNNRAAVDVISKRVLEQLGDGHKMSDIQMRKLSDGADVDRYTGYMNILNDMAGRDPTIAAVAKAYNDYMTNDAQAAMKYRAAFKSKEGVIGAEGRKSWLSAKENAKAGVKNEMQALESMNKWSQQQQALAKIKQFNSDPEIEAPVAKELVQRYLDNVQGRNQGPLSQGVNGLVNGFAHVTGIGPSTLKSIVGKGKTGLLTLFIGLGKLSHSFVTLVQPLQGIPVVNSLMKAEGAKLGLTQITAALKSFGSQTQILTALASGKDVGDPFLREALKFAKANDSFNSSQFQFGKMTDAFTHPAMLAVKHIAEFNVTGTEAATRAFTYMYYSHMLRDLGLSNKEIFPAAHNAMKDVMVDYNSWERPGVFGKLGFLGDLTAMLTRYKFNQIDQFARATKYASHGQLGPMVTMLNTSIMAAGLRGIMAYSLANKLVQAGTTWAAKNNMMDKPTSLDEMLLHMLHGKSEDFKNVVKFGLPAALGLNMTGSLSHGDDIPDDPLGALIPQGAPMFNMGESLYQVARNPNKANAQTALYDLAPNSAKGILENAMFTDKATGKYSNPHSYETQTIRSPEDQMKRNFGFRPLHEANESLTTRIDNEQKDSEAQVRQDVIERVLRDIDSHGGKVTPELADKIGNQYSQKYVANNGDPNEIISHIVHHIGVGQALTTAQRAQGIPNNSLNSIFQYKRYEDLK